MKPIELEPRDGVTPLVRFPIITVTTDYLSGAYIDINHADLDALQLELDAIRGEALDASKAEWSGIDTAKQLAALIVAVESVEPYIETVKKAPKDLTGWTVAEDGKSWSRVTTLAIEVLRESESFKSIAKGALPLASVMAASGTAHRLRKLQRDQTMHRVLGRLWTIASLIEIDNVYSEPWPALGRGEIEQHKAVGERVRLLQGLSQRDSARLANAVAEHVDEAAALMESEEGN